MNRNRIRICGRKTTTDPTPPIAPSMMKSRMNPDGKLASTDAATHSLALSIQPIGASDQAKTAWNMTNSTANRISGPANGCRNSASARSDQRRPAVSETTASLAIRFACMLRP